VTGSGKDYKLKERIGKEIKSRRLKPEIKLESSLI
jgi:hypothetical protein